MMPDQITFVPLQWAIFGHSMSAYGSALAAASVVLVTCGLDVSEKSFQSVDEESRFSICSGSLSLAQQL